MNSKGRAASAKGTSRSVSSDSLDGNMDEVGPISKQTSVGSKPLKKLKTHAPKKRVSGI